jgi:hypothetical protein
MLRNIARFDVHAELIREGLGMPPDHAITGVEWIPSERAVRIVAEGPALPVVAEEEPVPRIFPCVIAEKGEDGETAHVWYWGIQK